MRSEKRQNRLDLLEIVSKKARVKEGDEAVRRVLREIFRNKKISTKELSYITQLPVPVVAAIRKELENEELVARNGGAFLTKKGEEFVKEQLGLVYPHRIKGLQFQHEIFQVPGSFMPLLEKLKAYFCTRPKPLLWLDQTHGTPETALRRSLFMLEKGDVEGRRIIFLGDDDFTSISVALLQAAKEITVVDIDQRLLQAIGQISQKENLNITCVESDLRNPLPQHLRQKYDVVFTDPPYTIAGLALFISRGITALYRKGESIYLAFAHQPPKRMLAVQKTLSAMGLAIVEYIPRFNIYEGAEMLANTTFLAQLRTTEKMKPLVKGVFKNKFYTGEITLTVRTYQCQCNEKIKVGTTERFRTIEELKAKGCPNCERKKGFKLIKKEKLKETLARRLVLRDFEWADFPSILEFEREIAKKSFPKAPILDREYHRRKLESAMAKEPNGQKVALLDNEIIGWMWLRTERDRTINEKFGYIKTIIIKPEHRRNGFGRKLIESANQYFLSKGVHRVDLIVSATNYEAKTFFEEVGFRSEHSTMRKYLKEKSDGRIETN